MSPPRAADRLGQRCGLDTLAFGPGCDRCLQPSRGGGPYSRGQRRAAATWLTLSVKGSNAFSEYDTTGVGAVTGRTLRNLAGWPGPWGVPRVERRGSRRQQLRGGEAECPSQEQEGFGQGNDFHPRGGEGVGRTFPRGFPHFRSSKWEPLTPGRAHVQIDPDMAGTKSKPNRKALKDGNDSDSGTDDDLDGSLLKKDAITGYLSGMIDLKKKMKTGQLDQSSGSESAPTVGAPGEADGAAQGKKKKKKKRKKKSEKGAKEE
ncbi:unnamed protein product [Polarella glacialis]|uniref:Uncharacterized protein n=1 Tax=Polarella glacialis TaxID=89957 RepID=A0A813HFX1_POLGL|nr:unnamed protein product [Polarella glacialis]CAE8654585.1 unnamed protein product [Polarella glacialis]